MNPQKKIMPLFLGLITLLFLSRVLHAAGLEHLVMPGPVIQGHAKYENNCKKCHKPFSKETQRRLCLDCHKKIREDFLNQEGLHGKSREINNVECRHCHTDHKGRNVDIVILDKEMFDHRTTDFTLKKSHLKIRCDPCHKPKVKFRDTPSKCIDCHKAHDPHKGRLGEKCAECHEESQWNKTRYDHSKTRYPLKGAHKKAACNSCHPDQRWKKTSKECWACHRLNDHHRGRYGKKCDQCHTPENKGTVLFPQKKDSPGTNNWKRILYNHEKTKFPLRNQHKKIPCEQCHTKAISREKLGTNCYSCHKKDDTHNQQQGKKCEQCHNDRGWKKKIFFDHDLTRFPLIGLHAIPPCEECHLTNKYQQTPKECIRCHQKDDEHKGRLGTRCGQCHNPNGWKLWAYDHNRQSEFHLTGAHENLECHACHRQVVKNKIRLSTTCFSCHLQDDVHQGRFGRPCRRCHLTTSFKNIKFGAQQESSNEDK